MVILVVAVAVTVVVAATVVVEDEGDDDDKDVDGICDGDKVVPVTVNIILFSSFQVIFAENPFGISHLNFLPFIYYYTNFRVFISSLAL